MTPAELNYHLARLNLTKTRAAEILGVSRQQVHNWLAGKHKIPKSVKLALASMRPQAQ